MGSKIDCYVDCVSPTSYYAFLYLQKHKDVLSTYGVEVEFHPVFLGGIMADSGNQPPWKLPAKAAHAKFENRRANNYFGVPDASIPDIFPIVSLLPQRCLTYIKETYPKEKFEALLKASWVAMFQGHKDLSNPDTLADVLMRHFNKEDTKTIIEAAQTQKYKQKLLDSTQKAIKLGAFGAPWFWVKNRDGKEEPFFGSDRFHFMWEFLGLPWTDIGIREKSKI